MTPTLERVLVYPVKSLDSHALSRATVRENGGLTHDREFAIVDGDGEYVNGKRERRIHRLRSSFDPTTGELTLSENGERATTFDLEGHGDIDGGDTADERTADDRRDTSDGRSDLEAWLSSYFDEPVELRRDEAGGFPDDTLAAGPTLISEATLETVAGWFDGIDAREMERRLRPNLVVSGVEPFWEDRLYKNRETAVAFRVGDCEFLGSNPCQRCVVPTRDPDTGEETLGFRRTFIEKREETLPEWADRAWYDHYFRLMVNTFVPEETVDGRIHVGAEIEILGERPYPA